jgi:hypothetical protein
MDDLINEEFTDEFSILAEEEIRDGKKQICFRGILSEANKINRNLRIYPEAVLREACLNAIDAAKKSGQPVFGELEHASDPKVHLERIAVTFPELTWNEAEKRIEGKAIPTLTEAGKVVEGLAKSGFKICFSTRCSGRVKPYNGPLLTEAVRATAGKRPVVEVCPGLKIISIDVVGQPSCQAAVTNTMYESELLEDTNKARTNLRKIFADNL